MPIRNPFARRPGPGLVVQDENARPVSGTSQPGFEKVDTVGSKASSALSLGSAKSHDTGDYKMSVVNDSGVYLPPSPTEEKGLWPSKYLSSGRNSTDTRNSIGDIEHFSISRESFDSYRRSFDVSARSPVTSHDLPPRQSLDSAGRFPRLPRSALDRKAAVDQHPTVEESGFEDVGLNDESGRPNGSQNQQNTQQRKRGLFSRFGDSNANGDGHSHGSTTPSNNAVSRFLMPGRKRAQSGQGSELGSMERPKTATSVEVTTEVH